MKRLLFLLAFLLFCNASSTAQICRCSEIPSSVRAERLRIADAALERAGQQRAAIQAAVFPFGLPKPPSNARNERLLFQMEWITLYDDDLRSPLWVAYELTREHVATVGGVVRQDCFRHDKRLENNIAPICGDFSNNDYDQGHMVPANDCKRSQVMMDNSFLLTNMAPQHMHFNQAIWERLEENVNKWARTADLFIITGAIFDWDKNAKRDPDSSVRRTPPLNRVALASHFYKILIHVRPNGVIDTKSFILPHDETRVNNNLPYLGTKIKTIDEIEEVTGIDFFPNMEDAREAAIEAGRAAGLVGWFTF